MNIKRNFIVIIPIISIQLSFIIAQDGYKSKYLEINSEKLPLPLRFKSLSANSVFSDSKRNPVLLTRKTRQIDANKALHQEIDALTSHVQNIMNYIEQIISNSKINIRQRRSTPPHGFNRPSSSEDKLKILDSKVKSILTIIEGLKNSAGDSETAERLESLEAATENLQRYFDDINRQNIAQMNNLENFVNTLTTNVDDLKQQVETLQRHFNEKQEQERPKLLRSEIIENIKGRDIAGAVEKLCHLTGGLQKNINLIVHEVYDNQAGNFDLILLFGDNENVNITVGIAVYQALSFEMESNQHNDYMKLLRLIAGVYNKMIHSTLGPISQTYDDALELDRKLHVTIKDKIASEIANAVATNNYPKVSEIFEKIYTKYTDSFNAVIKEALSDVVHHMDIERLVNFFETHKYPSQRILVYSAAFDDLIKTNNLDQSTAVTIAFGVKDLMNIPLDTNTKNDIRILKKAFPRSVLNLITPFAVCIKNAEFNEHIYAANDLFKSDINRRVFTWIPGDVVTQGKWSIDKKVGENKYFIRNIRHINESLFASANEYDNNNWRKVFALNPNTSNNLDLFTWTFEPSGNNVYIKNTLYNEYLFASENLYDTERRHVYTSVEKNKRKGGLWKVEQCFK